MLQQRTLLTGRYKQTAKLNLEMPGRRPSWYWWLYSVLEALPAVVQVFLMCNMAVFIFVVAYIVCCMVYMVLVFAFYIAMFCIFAIPLSLLASLTYAVAYICWLIVAAFSKINTPSNRHELSKFIFSYKNPAKTSQIYFYVSNAFLFGFLAFFLFCYCYKTPFFEALTRKWREPVRQARREPRRNNPVRDNQALEREENRTPIRNDFGVDPEPDPLGRVDANEGEPDWYDPNFPLDRNQRRGARYEGGNRTTHSWSPRTRDQVQEATAMMRSRLLELEEQLMREEEAKQCVVCMDKSRQVMIRPCNHYCVCEECIEQLRRCPICNNRIRRHQRVFDV